MQKGQKRNLEQNGSDVREFGTCCKTLRCQLKALRGRDGDGAVETAPSKEQRAPLPQPFACRGPRSRGGLIDPLRRSSGGIPPLPHRARYPVIIPAFTYPPRDPYTGTISGHFEEHFISRLPDGRCPRCICTHVFAPKTIWLVAQNPHSTKNCSLDLFKQEVYSSFQLQNLLYSWCTF